MKSIRIAGISINNNNITVSNRRITLPNVWIQLENSSNLSTVSTISNEIKIYGSFSDLKTTSISNNLIFDDSIQHRNLISNAYDYEVPITKGKLYKIDSDLSNYYAQTFFPFYFFYTKDETLEALMSIYIRTSEDFLRLTEYVYQSYQRLRYTVTEYDIFLKGY